MLKTAVENVEARYACMPLPDKARDGVVDRYKERRIATLKPLATELSASEKKRDTTKDPNIKVFEDHNSEALFNRIMQILPDDDRYDLFDQSHQKYPANVNTVLAFKNEFYFDHSSIATQRLDFSHHLLYLLLSMDVLTIGELWGYLQQENFRNQVVEMIDSEDADQDAISYELARALTLMSMPEFWDSTYS